MTGEEYLNSRENYEKQLRMMQTDDMTELRRQLRAANARILELESSASVVAVPVVPEVEIEIPAAPAETPAVLEESHEPVEKKTLTASQANEEMLSLKAKAALIQRLLNERNGEGK